MLTNFQLIEICNNLHIPLQGVFMKDNLPSYCEIGNYIINLQSSKDGNGTHWTVLLVRVEGMFFMDSFGAAPSVEIVSFCKKRKGHLGFNNQIIQDLKSSNCGWYCIALLHFMKGKKLYKPINSFINQFDENTKKNDDILLRYFM